MTLNPRQLQLLRFIADGLTYQQIASRTDHTHEAVKTAARRVFARLGAVNAANAVALGYRYGLLTDGAP